MDNSHSLLLLLVFLNFLVFLLQFFPLFLAESFIVFFIIFRGSERTRQFLSVEFSKSTAILPTKNRKSHMVMFNRLQLYLFLKLPTITCNSGGTLSLRFCVFTLVWTIPQLCTNARLSNNSLCSFFKVTIGN